MDQSARGHINDGTVRRDLKELCEKTDFKIVQFKPTSNPKSKVSWFVSAEHKEEGQRQVDSLVEKEEKERATAKAESLSQREHEKRRDFIVELISILPEQPKRKHTILDKLGKHPDILKATEDVIDRDLRRLVDSKKLVAVGKERGKNKGWILPEHEKAGQSFFMKEEEERNIKLTNRNDGYAKRRSLIIEKIKENPEQPKSRDEIGRYVKEMNTSKDESGTVTVNVNDRQINLDLHAIVGDLASGIIMLGNERSPLRSYILKEHKEKAIEEQKSERRERLKQKQEARKKYTFNEKQVCQDFKTTNNYFFSILV